MLIFTISETGYELDRVTGTPSGRAKSQKSGDRVIHRDVSQVKEALRLQREVSPQALNHFHLTVIE